MGVSSKPYIKLDALGPMPYSFFIDVMYSFCNKQVFVPAKPLQASQMFAGKAGVFQVPHSQ
jgi:hypothetical protein